MEEFKEFPISLGLGCRINCSYCCVHSVHVPAYKKLGGATTMTPDLLRLYMRTIPRDSILVWSGFSEPFLNPHLPELIREYHADGWQMRLDTTLAGCSIESAKLVASIPWRYLKIHLPSAGDDMRLDVTPEYLEVLRIVCTSPVFKCFAYFGTMLPEIGAILATIPPEQTDYYTRLHSRAGNLKSQPVPLRVRGKLQECLWLRRGHLLPNGQLALCCNDWSLKHIIGDLNHEDYQSIFKKPEFLELVAAHEDESKPLLCRNCDDGYYPD